MPLAKRPTPAVKDEKVGETEATSPNKKTNDAEESTYAGEET